MGGDGSKLSGGSFSPLDGSRTETDNFSTNWRPHPPISSRSQSVPTKYYGRSTSSDASGDDLFEDPGSSSKETLKRHRGSMVVVNSGQDCSVGKISDDPLMKKLEELHFFYPLMHDVEKRSGLFGTHNRKALAEIQSKIKSLPSLKIVRVYENRLIRHADIVSTRQGALTSLIKAVDIKVGYMLKSYTERTKVTAKYVDRLNKMDDLKRNLRKCQESFNESIAIVELLNGMLPETERLENFDPWKGDEEETDEEASECIPTS